jgi:hypothetical protein
MSKPIVDNPDTLAGVVTALGGTVIPGRTFRFDLPRANVKEVVEKISKLGVGVRSISERTESGPKTHTVCTLELYKPDEHQRTWQIPNW